MDPEAGDVVVNEVEAALRAIRSGRSGGNELIYDPATGMLTLKARGAVPEPGELVAGTLAREGFFSR